MPSDSFEVSEPLNENDALLGGWYGRNDFKPLPCGKLVCYTIVCIVLSPIILVLLLLYLLIIALACCFMDINANQMASATILGFEAWYKAPGKLLKTRENAENNTTDVIISSEQVEDGYINTCKKISMRKSVEWTLMDYLRKSKYWSQIQADTNWEQPHFLIHGWTDPYDPNGDEIWFTPACVSSWGALYSWSGRLPPKKTQAIPLADCPEILGYMYLFDIENADEFYATTSRCHHVGAKAANAPDHTPETEGKFFARYNYGQTKYMGDFSPDVPDAYIFKGKVLQDAKLRVLHTFVVKKPGSDQV